jgi:hypothetical protein
VKSFLTVVLLAVASLSGGCSRPIHVLPADESAASKIKTELEATRSFVVNERFVVLPVGWEDSQEGQGVFLAGAYAIKSSAWSQSAYGFSPSQGQGCSGVLNLIVTDLETGARRRVFDHHVAAWVHPFTFKEEADTEAGLCPRCGGARQQKTVLRYPGLLILIARTQDTNADKQIDNRDSEWLFAYHVPGGKLNRVSPEGYRVEYVSLLKDTLLVFLAPESAPLGNTGTLAIYKYEPKTDKGELIKDIR